MNIPRYFILLLCFITGFGQVTRRENNILLRKKRYLTFPQGSNFVLTGSYIKPVMIQAPKGHIILGECDVPFPLPFDTRWFKNAKRPHHRQKRDILQKLETAFNEYGLNGNACVKRIICEAQELIPSKGKSLVTDLLSAVFLFPETDEIKDNKFANFCNNSTFIDCTFPFLHIVMGSLTNY